MPSSRTDCRYWYALTFLFGVIFALYGCASSSRSNGGSGNNGGGGGSTPLTVMTTSLPGGTVSAAYSYQLAAGGGTAPYTWTTTSNNLPAGLTLSATGVLSGTPTAAASNVAVAFKVTDSSTTPQTATATLTITITNAPSTFQITTAALPNGQINTAYSTTLAATGGTTPYTWSIQTGTLPTGLTLNPSTGVISGTPTANANATPIVFKVTDASTPPQTATAGLTLTITGTAPLAITTTSLPNGQVGIVYSTALAATGGTTPYSWQITNGALPTGLSLSASGAITGTPAAGTQVNSTPLTVKVTDSGNPAQAATANLTLTITSATLTVTTTSLPSGVFNQAYTTTLGAIGGTAPYTWALTSGSLPAGLSLSMGGVISGIPTAVVTNAPFTVKATDSGSPTAQTATANLTLTVTPSGVAVTTTSLPNGQVDVAYATTLAANGGTAPYTWSITSGALPNGLSLNTTTGAITGTPASTITSTPITFKVTDSTTPTAQTNTANLTLTIGPPTATINITTTSLPNGAVGTAYSTTLTANGGVTPYTWTITSGTLPNGLSLNATTGAITGTPTTSVSNLTLTFQVMDSSTPTKLTQTANLTLTIASSSNISVSMTPVRAGLATTQALSITATINDAAGVNWSVTNSGGSFSAGTSTSGNPVIFTAGGNPGTYTITATSVTAPSQTASAMIYITNLQGVYTYHNDLARDGANIQEYALSPSTVATSTFGKLFSCTVDGAVYAQPLWVASLTIGGANHNVVFVATQHESLYAFDADANPCVQLWQASLIDTAHGGTGSETSVPSGSGGLVGYGYGDITPETGVTGTPVIDPSTNTLYVVAKSVNQAGPTFYQRIHAIDIFSGNEKFGGPQNITSSVTFPGTHDGGSTVSFNARQQLQRPGLALVNGVVYVAWASHEDFPPYYGWLVGFNASDLSIASVLNVSPNVGSGGIWMSGGAPSADSNGNLYFITGNAVFDATNSSAPNNDYGDSFLQVTPGQGVTSYFTPSDQSTDDANDADFGAGGAAIVLNLTTGSLKHLVIGGGKDGTLYLLNGDSMGGLGDSNARQNFSLGHGIFSTGAFWNNNLFIAAAGGALVDYPFNTSTNLFNTSTVGQSPSTYSWPGTSPSVSSTGSSNGIVWALNNSTFCTAGHPCGPTVLHAYDATSIATELWNSSGVSADAAGNAVKFTVPTVANGKVYVGTRGSNNGGNYTSGCACGELDVYGLKPN